MTADRTGDRRRARFLDQLRADGEPLGGALGDAFARVPREAFLADGFRTAAGRWVAPRDPDFLTEVYRNDALVTKVDRDVPVSSSSQPSLMVGMLAALDLRPGVRVLEIGAGTGYNAALMAALGAEVTSLDVQPDVVDRARAALARAGATGVRVVLGDGYPGHPADAPYDRVIVTVGVTGLSPAWLAQLAPDGYVLAPVAHVGMHPVLRVARAEPGTGYGVCGAGFMAARGPLGAAHPWLHPAPPPGRTLPAPTVHRPARWARPLGPRGYLDLAVAAGAWHPRVTPAGMAGVPDADWSVLDATGLGGAALRPDGAVAATGPEAAACADVAGALVDRWERAGCPGVPAWRVALASAGMAGQPILVPRRWRLFDEPTELPDEPTELPDEPD